MLIASVIRSCHLKMTASSVESVYGVMKHCGKISFTYSDYMNIYLHEFKKKIKIKIYFLICHFIIVTFRHLIVWIIKLIS